MDLMTVIVNFDADAAEARIQELDQTEMPLEHRECAVKRYLGMCIMENEVPTFDGLEAAFKSMADSVAVDGEGHTCPSCGQTSS